MPSANLTIARPKIITVLGAGEWGATIAKLARRNRNIVRLWSSESSQPLSSAIAQADIIISTISSAGVIFITKRLQDLNLDLKLGNVILVTATQGLDCVIDKEITTPFQIWQAAFPNHPLIVLSGANLASEIAQGLPAATIAASTNQKAAKTVQQALTSDSFWVHLAFDPLGTELGGILKSIIAIAIGVCDGLELGSNARAIILTQAMPEMIRLGTYLGGEATTFLSLSGWGDLVVSCNSASRNYQIGYQLAQGKSLTDIDSQLTGITKDVKAIETFIKVAVQAKIDASITSQVLELLRGKVSPYLGIYNLISSDIKPKFSSLNLLEN